MLVPAALYKDEINKELTARVYTDEYFYFSGTGHTHTLRNLDLADGIYDYAIVDSEGTLLGIFSYRVCCSDSIDCISVYSFEKNNPIVVIDVYREMKRLVKEYRRVEWGVVSGNKIKPAYDKFCKKYNGQIMKFRDCTYDNHGKLHSEYRYEILQSDWRDK